MGKNILDVVDFLKYVIDGLRELDIKIYDAENRTYCISDVVYSQEDDILIIDFEDDEAADKHTNSVTIIRKLKENNACFKNKIKDLEDQIEALIKLFGGNADVIDALQEYIQNLNTEGNINGTK